MELAKSPKEETTDRLRHQDDIACIMYVETRLLYSKFSHMHTYNKSNTGFSSRVSEGIKPTTNDVYVLLYSVVA